MEFINEYFKVIQFLLWAIFAIVVFVLTATFPKKKDHAELKDRVKTIEDTYNTSVAHTQLETKVTTIQAQIKSIPSNETIHGLEKEMGEMKGSVDGMKDLLKNINNHVNMLVENEIKGSK